MSVHFMSQSVDWTTPPGLYAELDAEFHFDFDPCPLYGAAGEVDGLATEWGGATFCNPPYGREIGKWTRKARLEAEQGKTVVLLIPSRTDTRWWHEDIMLADEIRFVKGRLKFGGAKNPAPFPSAIVVWREGMNQQERDALREQTVTFVSVEEGKMCAHFYAGDIYDEYDEPWVQHFTYCPRCGKKLREKNNGNA